MNKITKEIDNERCELSREFNDEIRRIEKLAVRFLDFGSKIAELEQVYARSMAYMRKCLDEEIERRRSLESLLIKLQFGEADTTRSDDIEDLEADLMSAAKFRQHLINKIARMSKR